MNFAQLKAALIASATDLIGRETELCQLDSFVGDGDHGVSIRKGYSKMLEAVERDDPKTMSDLFICAAMGFADQTGGAIGPIVASFLLGMADPLKGKDELCVHCVAAMFEGGLKSVQDLGEAQPGDCTMVDSLYPAVQTLKNYKGESIAEAMKEAAEAAYEGAQSTANMIAKRGRAKNLEERSLGYVDAGSMSMYYFIKAFADSVSE